ncbi:unnamed protein product [Oikopleura dioica]|uniref:LUC7-like protein n=1 Tax=Oikopleura dioica TaxID=34765 RepID=E4YEV0_OIKDI|nr:unnamed protein product [Oikopleura dioica]
MATDYMRSMLNELMGSGRNDQNEDGEMPTTSTRFEDRDVCRPFLLKCCPHDVLTSTRADIGDCTLEHSLALRSDYERARQKNTSLMYEFDAHRALKKFIDETDERIETSKTKLAEKQADISKEIEEKANGVHEINEKIGKLLADAEKAGMEGEVGKSQEILRDVETLREEKRQAEQNYRNSMPSSLLQQQRLRVCEICSSYLGLHDNDRRLADHFGGKLHLGFIDLRKRLDDLKTFCEEHKEEFQNRKSSVSSEPQRTRSRSRERKRERRSRSRSRSSDRHRRRRRSRSRDRSRDRYRRDRHRSRR